MQKHEKSKECTLIYQTKTKQSENGNNNVFNVLRVQILLPCIIDESLTLIEITFSLHYPLR